MTDMLGDVIDTVQTGAQFLDNMNQYQFYNQPNRSSDLGQYPIRRGLDAWGLSLENNTLPYMDDPVAYA